MKALARSVIEAARFLEMSGDDDIDPDHALRALECIADELAGACVAEKQALREALNELVEAVRAGPLEDPPRPQVLEFYRDFMESFGIGDE